MTLNESERRATNPQALNKEAIDLATQGRWLEALEVNREIIELFPHDVSAYNRLGKAMMELGRYKEAREAFSRGLDLAPSNTIAKKNLQKISLLMETAPAPQRILPKITAHQFIEETGKTGVTKLVKVGAPEVIAHLSAGEPVQLRVDGKNLIVEAMTGEHIGQVEPRLASRLLYLTEEGNRYEGAITSAQENAVTVILREVYQHPSLVDRVSFPSKSADDFRSYVKKGFIKDEQGEEEPDQEGESVTWQEREEVPEGMSIIAGERETTKFDDEDDEGS